MIRFRDLMTFVCVVHYPADWTWERRVEYWTDLPAWPGRDTEVASSIVSRVGRRTGLRYVAASAECAACAPGCCPCHTSCRTATNLPTDPAYNPPLQQHPTCLYLLSMQFSSVCQTDQVTMLRWGGSKECYGGWRIKTAQDLGEPGKSKYFSNW